MSNVASCRIRVAAGDPPRSPPEAETRKRSLFVLIAPTRSVSRAKHISCHPARSRGRRITKREGRNIIVAGCQVASIATTRGNDEEMAALALLEGVPVAEEKAIGDLRFYFALRRSIFAILRALDRLACRIDIGCEGKELAIG